MNISSVFLGREEQKQNEVEEGVVMVMSQLQNNQKVRRVEKKRVSHQKNRQLMLAYGTSTACTVHLSVCSTAAGD